MMPLKSETDSAYGGYSIRLSLLSFLGFELLVATNQRLSPRFSMTRLATQIAVRGVAGIPLTLLSMRLGAWWLS